MKTTDQNQMDLLLRALGRDASARSPLASPPQSGQEIGAHLDADELNCYAEGIVSGAERARYNKHLADCDICRRIVTGLVPAAAVTRRREVAEQNLGWNLREKLAALLAPSVLRFAVPALALTAIIAIAIVALRRQEQTNFVAQNQTQTSPAISGGGENQNSTTENVPQSAMSPAQPSSAESKEKNLSRSAGTIQPPAVAPSTSSTTDRAAKGLVKPGQATGVAESKPFATEPTEAAAPPPPPRPALADASKTAEARKQEEDADMEKRRRDLNYSRARDENEVARAGPAKGGPSRNNSQNVGGLSSGMSRTANKDQKAAGNAVETRRVSGRLFRREGNAWIDSDYAAGRARVNVKRDSEQFRALIADEPALGSIAEQLGGEVIVVWKGTTYRIH
ncbi:MAG: hypothetical protein H0U60_00930 [Blastocatellia bacterium]|nr:hypothetical protein [Blastocatellia bacterium]